jgi:hypothetical protein
VESEAKLLKQFGELKENLEKQQQEKEIAETEIIANNKIAENEIEQAKYKNELALQERFDAMQKQLDEQNLIRIKENEEKEQRLKEEYEKYKENIARQVVELEQKNNELQEKLERTLEEKKHLEEDGEKTLDLTIKDEFDKNEKKLREMYMQLRTELSKEARQIVAQNEEVEQEKESIRAEKEALEDEKARLTDEIDLLKSQFETIMADAKEVQTGGGGEVVSAETVEQIRNELEQEYKERERAMLEKLERERQSLAARESQVVSKEATLAKEETRIKEESQIVATMMSNREYSTEERERIVLDYRDKMAELAERLRLNEKAIRENNREFVPLRRIKNTFDRDMRLLRKREAIIAKQEVIVYGVNNISTVDPARIKKLEQDVKQLSALQQSVANCEIILNKNKDRYPTLENLDKVLHAQNEQIKADIDEVKAAMAIFGETGSE